MGRRQRRRDPATERRWRRLIKDWRRSGLSVCEFCDWQGLSEASFYAWRRELAVRDREAASHCKTPVVGPATKVPQFLPVHVVAEAAQDSGEHGCLDVQLPTGVRLRVPPRFDRETLADVLAALGVRPC
jgi:transposase-like protein